MAVDVPVPQVGGESTLTFQKVQVSAVMHEGPC